MTVFFKNSPELLLLATIEKEPDLRTGKLDKISERTFSDIGQQVAED